MKPRVPVKFTLVWKQGGRQENIVRIAFAVLVKKARARSRLSTA
jgi:hypothetical protein